MHGDDPCGEDSAGRIRDALGGLPLFDNLFLNMQALNLDVVDGFLETQEARLLDEYLELERTPIDTYTFVSALSQLWVFGLYELLRTWRQRAQELLRFAEDLERLSPPEREAKIRDRRLKIEAATRYLDGMDIWGWSAFERIAHDPNGATTLRRAVDRSERLFRRIEALRISLAKHEVPKSKGLPAMAPGVGGIDKLNGSVYWQIVLRGEEVDVVSRRAIADECRALLDDSEVLLLPAAIQPKVRGLPEIAYGVNRVTVVLDDGREYQGVYIGWGKEILEIDGFPEIPFDPMTVVDVRNDAE